MVEVFDLNKNTYEPNANFWQLCDLQKFDTFNGVSFVSNLKFVERFLLPRFDCINLILGLSDNGKNPIGQFMQGILEQRADYAEKINLSDELKERILDGRLNFKFTKKADALIHSKFYLLTNENSYSCFVGSMNLTNSAVNKNHEMLTYFTGMRDDAHYAMFNNAWQNNWNSASEYLDAKHLSGIYHDKKQDEIAVSIYHDSTQMLSNSTDDNQKNVYLVDKEEVKNYHDENVKHFDDLDTQSKITVMQTAKIFGDRGSLRQKKTLENVAPDLIDVKQKLLYVNRKQTDQEKAKSDLDLYPSPIMTYNQDLGAIYMAPRLDDNIHLTKLESYKPTYEDTKIFVDIVNEYQTSKLAGEGQQACNYLLYLFETPFLWKIRQMYDASSTIKAREDVPIGAILIGNGKTGKTTLGAKLTKSLIGETDFVKAGNTYFGPSQNDSHLSKFVSRYLRTGGPISPIIIDDADTAYFTKTYFASSVKDIANDSDNMDPAPAVIYTTNLTDDESNARISNKPELLRRLYYLGFESPFKAGQDKYANDLLSRANDKLFKFVQLRLNDFFSDVSVELEQKIEDDYLYPVKTILKEILTEYDLFDQVEKYFNANYNYIMASGKRDWKTLVESATYQKLINFIDNGKTANFPKELFKQLSNSLNRDNGSTVMKRYFHNLPEEYEISANITESGFDVDVARFDEYMGTPILKKLYEDKAGITEQKLKEKEHQRDLDYTTDAIVKALQVNNELNAKKKHHLFGWFKKRKND